MYTHVVRCHEGAPPLIRPEGDRYQYFFGDDFFVAPIYRDATRQTVDLPPGTWRLLDHDRETLVGARRLARDFPLAEFPVYVRDGAIVPMNVERAYTGFGDKDSKGFQTWAIWPRGTNEFVAHQPDGTGTTTVRVESGNSLRVAVTGTAKPHVLRIRLDTKPSSVSRNGRPLAEGSDWHHDAADARLWIRTRDPAPARYDIR